jgi:hypothetical protein
MNVPIACRLTPTAARSRVDEWRQVLDTLVAGVEHVSPTELRLPLRDLDGVETVARLAQREKDCCAFFEFSLLIEADSVALRIVVPDGAASVLNQLEAWGR